MARLNGWFTAVILIVFCAQAQSQTSSVNEDPFTDDARFAQKASLRVEGLPICEFLSLLSEKSGIRLTVEQDIGDEKVIAFNAARPIHDILIDLAVLFHNGWERIETKGQPVRYRLVRTKRNRAFEDSLAQTRTRRILDQLQDQVRALAETPEQLAKRSESDSIRQALSNPKTRTGTMLYGALSREQQASLLAKHVCFVRFGDLSPLQQKYSNDLFAGFVTENHAYIQDLQDRYPGAVIGNHRLEQEELQSDSIRFFVDGGKNYVSIFFGLTGDLMTTGQIAWFDKSKRYLLPIHGNPYSRKPLVAAASLPDPKSIADASSEKDWLDQLRKLAETSGTPVMADYFRAKDFESFRPPPPLSITSQNNADVVSVLDRLCEPRGYLWWTSDKTLLLRTREWYETRKYEVPDRWFLDVSKSLQANHGVPLYADVLRLLDLTPEQMYGLQSGFFNQNPSGQRTDGFAQEKELLAARNLLELLRNHASPSGNGAPVPAWEDLTKHQFDKTLGQVILTFDTMSPVQRSLIPGFLQSQPHQYTTEQLTDFFAVLYRPRVAAQTGEGDYKNVPIKIYGGFGTGVLTAKSPLSEMQSSAVNPVTLTLPLSVPDDRRKNTRIEVTP